MMRWAGFAGDVASYPVYGYESTTREQKLTLGTKAGDNRHQTSVHLTVLKRGVPIDHTDWHRAADDEQVNGRPTFWFYTFVGEFNFPWRKLDWDYVDGNWARMELFQNDVLPPAKSARAIAETVRFGRPERVKLPMRFTEPLPGMVTERVSIDPFDAAKRDVSVGLSLRGADHDGVARVDVHVSTPDPNGQLPRPHHTTGYTTVDGHPAVRWFSGPNGDFGPVDKPEADTERLTVFGVGGMTVSVAVQGVPTLRNRFAPHGAAGVFGRLTVVDDPAHWF